MIRISICIGQGNLGLACMELVRLGKLESTSSQLAKIALIRTGTHKGARRDSIYQSARRDSI